MKNRTLEIYNGGRKMIGNGRRGVYILSALFLLIFYGISFAQDASQSNWLLGVIFKLERMKDNSEADIQKYTREIQKSESTVRKSEDIIRKAQQKGNAQAEMIARQALTTAQEAKRKNVENKQSAELRKKRAEIAMANTHNMLADKLSQNQEIKSVVTNYSGNVSILRKNGETIPFENNLSGYLEAGDEIRTLGKSSAELQVLDGRGSLRLGEYSKIKMEEDSAGTQILNMMNGKMHVALDKLDEHQKMIEDKIRAYKEDLKTVKDEIKQKLVEIYEGYDKELRRWAKKKFEVRTPTVALAARATEFLVFEGEKTGTTMIVLEGSVEMKGTKGEKTIIVNAGYRGTATKDGILSEPEKLDLSKMERWWEE